MTPETLLRELKGLETRLGNLNRADKWHPDVKAAIDTARAQVTHALTVATAIRASVQEYTQP